MPLTVVTIMGGLGRVVIGGDGLPAHVGALGPMYIRLRAGDGIGTAEQPSLIRGNLARGVPRRAFARPRSWVHSRTILL